MKYAIIDIGSNSIRLSVYRYDEEVAINVIRRAQALV